MIPVQRIPKTTSGKVQRHKLVEAYLDGDFDGVFAKLEKLGLETVPGTVAERPGEFKFKERAFVDFDGHLVVLYQMLPLE